MTGQGRSAEGKETRSAKTNTHTRDILPLAFFVPEFQ